VDQTSLTLTFSLVLWNFGPYVMNVWKLISPWMITRPLCNESPLLMGTWPFFDTQAWHTSCNIWYSSAHIRRHASHHASYERLPENTNLISDIIEYFEWKFKLVLSPLVSLKITFITQHVNQFSLYFLWTLVHIL